MAKPPRSRRPYDRQRSNRARSNRPTPPPPPPQPATGGEPGFINPYNFVRWVSTEVQPDQPRTHEKYAGLSGRIVIELENITPICIPDPEKTDVLKTIRGQPRFKKPFLRVGEKPYIPGASLKGMLRSVAEAASNSCYSVFTKNMGVFRDNRPDVPGARGVGKLTQNPDNSLRLDYPGQNVQFSRRGLFNQESWRYRPRRNNPRANGQTIPNEIRDIYEKMVKDDKFTCNDQQPTSNQRRWLLDFGSNQNWWFREAEIKNHLKQTCKRVITFGRNFRYKWAYDPKQALPEGLRPCTEPHQLCPSCALFGMAEQRDEEKQQQEAQVRAFAGKIAVGPARWSGGTCDFKFVNDHKILGSPKFSCRSFYLKRSDETAFDVSKDEFLYMNENGELVPKKIDLIDRNKRYTDLFATGMTTYENIDLSDANSQFGEYVQAFREKMAEWNGRPFEDLPNIEDLKVILSQKQPECAKIDVPIIYPPGDDLINPEKETGDEKGNVHPAELNYEWFCRTMQWSEPLVTIQQIAQKEYQRREKSQGR